MLRLFTGLSIPESLVPRIENLQRGLPEARWSDPYNFHITLTFIGEVEEPQAEAVDFELSRIDFESFAISLSGLGFFERGHQPHAVWVAVEDNPALTALKSRVDAALDRAGVEYEHRKYVPHLTVGRVRQTPPEKIGPWLEQNNLFAAPSVDVPAFHLYQSHIGGQGAKYEIVASYPLTARAA